MLTKTLNLLFKKRKNTIFKLISAFCNSHVIRDLKKPFVAISIMEFINYFDIPKKELENQSIMSYLKNLYKSIEAPEGSVRAWYSLPHEDKDMKRICVFYSIDQIKEKKVAR